MALTLKSTAIDDEKMITPTYTCDGEDISPPLEWSDVPEGTQSFAIIFDDPDAPTKTWVHWLLYNIPGDKRNLEQQIPDKEKLGDGALHGINDFKVCGYGGPCPPEGIHRYFIKLYALDTKLDLEAGATKTELLNAMEGHIIEQAELMGKYQRR